MGFSELIFFYDFDILFVQGMVLLRHTLG